MLVGDRFEKNGKYYEVTRIIDDKNYAFREIAPEPVSEPVFDPVIEEAKENFAEEVKEAVKKRGRARKKV